MTGQMEKPQKIGTEITVRISLTFQEAPDVHTLLAMTPVRERGKLVRLALERYIAETGHPAGDVEQQIYAISTWLRSRSMSIETVIRTTSLLEVERTTDTENTDLVRDTAVSTPAQSGPALEETASSSSSIKRWLQV